MANQNSSITPQNYLLKRKKQYLSFKNAVFKDKYTYLWHSSSKRAVFKDE